MKEISFEPTSYQEILEANFKKRMARNSSYSLSAYARDLEISVPQLSAILKNKKGLSLRAAKTISDKLNLGGHEKEVFIDFVQAKHGRSFAQRSLAEQRLAAKQTLKTLALKEDIFRSIGDWQHFAILQLIHLKNFEPSIEWIANKLGIEKEVCKDSVERLFRLNILSEENGKWILPETHVSSPDGIPSEAIKKIHTQMLEKGKQALHEQSVDERDFGSVFFAINQEQLPEIKKVLKDFRKKISTFYQKSPGKDALYSLNLQLFRVDKK